MIVDTSAIMAIVLDEPDGAALFETLLFNSNSLSAGNWIELSAVVTRLSPNLMNAVDGIMKSGRIRIVSVTVEQAEIGHQAYRRYGRGTAHEARLNFGDCFAYALAKATGEPLLYKGDDFGHTDVVAAI